VAELHEAQRNVLGGSPHRRVRHCGDGQVDLHAATRRPERRVVAHVGEDDDMGGVVEDLVHALVLGREDVARCHLLGEDMEVVHVLRLPARDVDAHNGLPVVRVGHVLCAAVDHDGLAVADKVVAQPGFAVVARRVVDPVNGAPVGGRAVDPVDEALLPGPEDHVAELFWHRCLGRVDGLQLLGHAPVDTRPGVAELLADAGKADAVVDELHAALHNKNRRAGRLPGSR